MMKEEEEEKEEKETGREEREKVVIAVVKPLEHKLTQPLQKRILRLSQPCINPILLRMQQQQQTWVVR